MKNALWRCSCKSQWRFTPSNKEQIDLFYFGYTLCRFQNLQLPHWGNLTTPMCATHCEFSKKLKSVQWNELSNCAMLNEHNVVLCCNRRQGYFLTKLFFVWFFFLAWVCFSFLLDWLHLNTKLGFAEQFIEATLCCTETSQAETVVGLSPGRRDFSESTVHFTSNLWLSCCLPFIMPLFL